MKKTALLLLVLFGCITYLYAENAFTIHDGANAPVHVYYDTNTLSSHIILSIFPCREFKISSVTELHEWLGQDLPICGSLITILSEANHNTFYVRVGSGAESVYGYVKKGTVAVATRNYDKLLYLYKSNSYKSSKQFVSYEPVYATIFGIKGSWFYVVCKGENGKTIRGWLPPEMQCPSFYTTCP